MTICHEHNVLVLKIVLQCIFWPLGILIWAASSTCSYLVLELDQGLFYHSFFEVAFEKLDKKKELAP